MKVKSVEVVPYLHTDSLTDRLFIVARTEDGVEFWYARPFFLKDRPHAEYFARLVRDRGEIEPEHWHRGQQKSSG